MKMEFNKTYNATKFMEKLIKDQKLSESYKTEDGLKIYLATDTWDVWVYRVHENLNEEFEESDGEYLIEANKIKKSDIMNKLVKEFDYEKPARTVDERNYLVDAEACHIAEATLNLDFEDGLSNWDMEAGYFDFKEVESAVSNGWSHNIQELELEVESN